jgi:hypothetical protein
LDLVRTALVKTEKFVQNSSRMNDNDANGKKENWRTWPNERSASSASTRVRTVRRTTRVRSDTEENETVCSRAARERDSNL